MRRCRSPAEGTSWPLLTAVAVCVNKTTSSPCGATSELKDEKIKETQTKKTTRRLKVSSAPRRWSCDTWETQRTPPGSLTDVHDDSFFGIKLPRLPTTQNCIYSIMIGTQTCMIRSVTWPRAARWDEGLDDTFRKWLNVRTWCWTAALFYSEIHFIITCHRVSDESRGLRGIGRFSRISFDIMIVFHKIVKRSQIPLCCRPHPRPVSLRSLYTQVRSMFSIFIVTRRFHRSMRKKKKEGEERKHRG